MENTIDTRKVNRSLFAYRVVDVHNDEFGFAQDGYIYTYVTDSNSKTKGSTWLRMQSTGEHGKDRRKYFLYFGDETEYSAIVDKHNDIYDLEGNYVASLIRSRFIIFLLLFVMVVILLTGLATYLGGSMIMDTSTPFSQDKTIHIAEEDNTDGKGSKEVDMDIINDDNGDSKKADTTTRTTTKGATTQDTTTKDTTTKDTTEDGYSGKITSKTEGVTGLIWPGHGDEYTFYIQNDGKKPLEYQLSFAANNTYKLPIRYKLLENGEYIVGSDSEWGELSDLNIKNHNIAPGVNIEYTIVWEWEDKGTAEGDEFDTKIGTEGIAEYILHASVYFESLF